MALGGHGPGRPRNDAPATASVVPPNAIAWNPPASTAAWNPSDPGGPHVSQSVMEQAGCVLAASHEARPESAGVACEGKAAKSCVSSAPLCAQTTHLQTIQIMKKSGNSCFVHSKNRADTSALVRSGCDHVTLAASCSNWFANQLQLPPEPANPVGNSAMAQQRGAAI